MTRNLTKQRLVSPTQEPGNVCVCVCVYVYQILEQLRNWLLLEKGSSPWSYIQTVLAFITRCRPYKRPEWSSYPRLGFSSGCEQKRRRANENGHSMPQVLVLSACCMRYIYLQIWELLLVFNAIILPTGARGSVICWDTMLQTGRSQVRFPMKLFEFLIVLILPVALWPWGRLSL
jgi:hypothetical protein